MQHEEECVLLKESNMEDPLADPLDIPPPENLESDEQSDEDQRSETSEGESSEHNDKNSISEEPEVEEEVMKEENFPHECDVCGKRFKTVPGKLTNLTF